MMCRSLSPCFLLPLLLAAAASAALDKAALQTALEEHSASAKLEREIQQWKQAGSDSYARARLNELNKRLHAVKREDDARRRAVTACLEKVQRSGNINACDKNGRTLLMAVANTGVDQATDLVLQENPDLTLTDREGHSALWYEQRAMGGLIHAALMQEWCEALEDGDAQRVSRVLDCGFAVSTPTAKGNPALGEAMDRGLEKVVTELLAHDAGASYPMADGRSLLEVAVEKNESMVITRLLANGANAEEPMRSGESMLRYLLRYGKPETVLAFLKGAELGNHAEGDTCVCCLAARYASAETLQALLTTLQKPHEEDAYGNTPLLEAARRGHPDVYNVVVNSGSFSWTNSRGETPLMHAALSGSVPMVQRVLETMPAELRSQADKAGRRAADYAALLANPQPIQELLAQPAE